MKVLLSNPRGFCAGVDRAIEIVERALTKYGAPIDVLVTPSAHKKCERCWHYRADVGADAAHPDLCGRCVSNTTGSGESRTHA